MAKATKRKRPTRTEQGYNNRWLRAANQFRQENPLCVFCLRNNRYVPANVVDHIIPHRGNMDLFWDKNNWQSLCHHCHSSTKQRMERNNDFGCDSSGDPLAPRLHW